MPGRARLAPWRGVGNGHNAFAAECFLDEIAKELGKDPIAFRLELSEGQPRMQTLLRAVAEMSDWTRKRDGRALGVATMVKDDTLAAGVAEVSVDRATGKIKVHNVWVRDRCRHRGAAAAISRRRPRAASSTASATCCARRSPSRTAACSSRTSPTTRSTRMSDVPNIEVKVVSTDNPPTGAGEDGLPVLACAVGNAIADADRRAAARAAVRARARARRAGGVASASRRRRATLLGRLRLGAVLRLTSPSPRERADRPPRYRLSRRPS